MGEKQAWVPSRRDAMAGVGAALAAGPAASASGGPGSGAGLKPVSEAHGHLFNAADLPVVAFLKYVLIPNHANQLGRYAKALVEIAARTIKSFAMSAETETAQLQGAPADGLAQEATPETFARLVAEEIARGRGARGSDPETADSHLDLARSLVAYGFPGRAAGRDIDLAARDIEASVKQLALDVDRLGGLDPTRAQHAARAGGASAGIKGVLQIIGWIYLMVKNRRHHVEVYLKAFRTSTARTRLIVNHLVDYDRWLHDGPGKGSEHETQWRFWAALAPKVKVTHDVEMLTFAGVCPLKRAEEIARGDAGQAYKAHKDAYTAKTIAGVKIYPPMGFRPIGNRRLANTAFGASTGIEDLVVDHWAREFPGQAIGARLDDALEELYHWCISEDVPVMAHAIPGNQAGEWFGQRANPVFWADVVARPDFKDLRLSLGHFTDHGGDFADAVLDGDLSGEWALGATRDLLKRDRVFADLGFMSELLTREAQARNLAKRFFLALRKYLQEVENTASEPSYRQILYGSDWIMLGQIVDNHKYLKVIRQGMKDAGYRDDAIARICDLNARRFLKRG